MPEVGGRPGIELVVGGRPSVVGIIIAAAEVTVVAGGGFVVVKPNILDMEKFEAAVVVAAG